jgi:RNA polymerase sigma-70 factor (ECF subfamily)
MNREDFQRAFNALRRLPELDRTALLLRAEAGLSYEEIAAATGLTAVGARVRVFRARAKIVALVQHETGERI